MPRHDEKLQGNGSRWVQTSKTYVNAQNPKHMFVEVLLVVERATRSLSVFEPHIRRRRSGRGVYAVIATLSPVDGPQNRDYR